MHVLQHIIQYGVWAYYVWMTNLWVHYSYLCPIVINFMSTYVAWVDYPFTVCLNRNAQKHFYPSSKIFYLCDDGGNCTTTNVKCIKRKDYQYNILTCKNSKLKICYISLYRPIDTLHWHHCLKLTLQIHTYYNYTRPAMTLHRVVLEVKHFLCINSCQIQSHV